MKKFLLTLLILLGLGSLTSSMVNTNTKLQESLVIMNKFTGIFVQPVTKKLIRHGIILGHGKE